MARCDIREAYVLHFAHVVVFTQDGPTAAIGGPILLRCEMRHSITSSAARRMPSGTSIPSALAVLRLTMNLNLVGSCTGRSPGLAPLRMRSTYKGASRNCSDVSLK